MGTSAASNLRQRSLRRKCTAGPCGYPTRQTANRRQRTNRRPSQSRLECKRPARNISERQRKKKQSQVNRHTFANEDLVPVVTSVAQAATKQTTEPELQPATTRTTTTTTTTHFLGLGVPRALTVAATCAGEARCTDAGPCSVHFVSTPASRAHGSQTR